MDFLRQGEFKDVQLPMYDPACKWFSAASSYLKQGSELHSCVEAGVLKVLLSVKETVTPNGRLNLHAPVRKRGLS
jgi:hypothetical protein